MYTDFLCGALSGFCIDGIKNMLGTVGYLYAVAGVIGVLNESGTMEKVIQKLINSKLNQTVVGSEIIMGLGIMLTSICLGSANGPAIIMFGPIADEIGKSKGLHPYWRANLLDGFASTLPVSIALSTLHCIFLFIVLAAAVLTGWGRRYEGEGGKPVKMEKVVVDKVCANE